MEKSKKQILLREWLKRAGKLELIGGKIKQKKQTRNEPKKTHSNGKYFRNNQR